MKHQTIFFLGIIFFFTEAHSTNNSKPHEHQGLLTPYTGAPPQLKLTTDELKRLSIDRPVYRKMLAENEKRALVIFRVSAPPAIAWSVIRNFKQYPNWIKNLTTTNVYRNTGKNVHVRFTARHWLIGKNTWYVKHFYPNDNEYWSTWTLDYNFRSSIDDSVGFWQVMKVIGEPEKSDIVYSATLRLKKKLPAVIQKSIAKQGLKETVRWVTQQSEALYSNQLTTEF